MRTVKYVSGLELKNDGVTCTALYDPTGKRGIPPILICLLRLVAMVDVRRQAAGTDVILLRHYSPDLSSHIISFYAYCKC